MPRGDGTGPRGQGRGTGRGRRGAGGLRQGGGIRAGPEGNCVCPACGLKVAHKLGVPCYDMQCPKCGGMMSRERVTGLND
jgi:hypothetical protein